MTWTTPRTWIAGEVVTASLLNTHLRDDMKVGRGYARAVRTAGNITINSTAWTNASTALDLTLAATTGDVLEATPLFRVTNGAVHGGYNATCVASGAGFSTRTANTDLGVAGWWAESGVSTIRGGPAYRTAASADISGGNVIVRLRAKTAAATNKIIQATTDGPLLWQVRNHGPNVAP